MRYFTRSKPKSFDIDDDTPLIPNIDVPEHEPSFTGLLDSKGDEIWRAPRPVGFGRDKEWC